MAGPYAGGCTCGAVRYRVSAEPVTLYACHCTDCQHRTGSAFGLSMVVPRESVVLERGTPVEFKVTMPDGRLSHSKACSACGTRVWGEPVKLPQYIIVRPGTLDDTSWIRPVAHIWTRSAMPGTVFEPGAVKFEQNAPPGELARLWKERGT
jgi:hypothetical protein